MEEKIRSEYYELLKFPSVGADPGRLKETTACAIWLREWLGKLGFSVELMSRDFAPPVVFAERRASPDAFTVLVYGHYDVQPEDPVAEWKTPPFEPTEIDGRIYCRGAQDDKGQTFAFLCGVRDLIEGGGLKVNLKIVLDGQEESGSGALKAMAGDIRRRLAADVMLVCDTGAAADLRPAIVAGLRGMAGFTLRVHGPNRDLHSGEYGGIAPNPAQGLAELVASLHNPDGSIAVAGFRDGIEPPTEAELAAAQAAVPDDAAFEADIGCAPVGGERGKSIVQRNSFEPTIEVNGIHAGYGGPGGKTVIPTEGFAKITMRLVPGQVPARILEAVRRHLEAHLPRGLRMTIDEVEPGIGGMRLPLASPVFRLAEGVLREIDPRGPVFMWDGASIPVVSVLQEASGAAPLLVGWGQTEDRIHSPNESYSWRQFALARDWAKRILTAF